jgi:ribonuclease J
LALEIIPLGGTGEIGKNLNLVRCDGEALIIDCGISFPGEDLPGVDLVIPDPEYLLSVRDELQAILLTHGHEDHVGALPYLLPRLGELPIYGTPLTLALIEQKLRERRLDAALNPIKPGTPFQVGHITVEPIRVTHSIPDCVRMRCAQRRELWSSQATSSSTTRPSTASARTSTTWRGWATKACCCF